MKSLDASRLRQEIADALNSVAHAGERIVIKRHGKRVAVLAPVDDLELLEAIEDRVDVALAKKALKEKGRIPWVQVRKELGCRSRVLLFARPRATRRIGDFVQVTRRAS